MQIYLEAKASELNHATDIILHSRNTGLILCRLLFRKRIEKNATQLKYRSRDTQGLNAEIDRFAKKTMILVNLWLGDMCARTGGARVGARLTFLSVVEYNELCM